MNLEGLSLVLTRSLPRLVSRAKTSEAESSAVQSQKEIFFLPDRLFICAFPFLFFFLLVLGSSYSLKRGNVKENLCQVKYCNI